MQNLAPYHPPRGLPQGVHGGAISMASCVVEGCAGVPAFGLPGFTTPTHCKDHALLLLSSWQVPPPAAPAPTFSNEITPRKKGPKGKREPVVKIPQSAAPLSRPPREYKGSDPRRQFRKSALCQVEGCVTLSSYGYPGHKASRCRAHMEPGMQDTQNRKCVADGCTKQATFGYPGKKKVCCKQHIVSGMVDLVSNMCSGEGCQKHASFGWPGQGATRCKEHMEEGMGDVKNKTCKIEGCKSQSYFGYAGQRPIRCRAHKEEGMEDVVTKRCNIDGCEARATYGWPGDRPIVGRIRCRQHKEPGMETMEGKRCTSEDCNLPARFGVRGSGGPRKCKFHMTPDMVNLKDKQCMHQGCNLHPKFGYPGGPRTHCKAHSEPGMRCHNWRKGAAGVGVVASDRPPKGERSSSNHPKLPTSSATDPAKKRKRRSKVAPHMDLAAAWNNLVADAEPSPHQPLPALPAPPAPLELPIAEPTMPAASRPLEGTEANQLSFTAYQPEALQVMPSPIASGVGAGEFGQGFPLISPGTQFWRPSLTLETATAEQLERSLMAALEEVQGVTEVQTLLQNRNRPSWELTHKG